jgi:uncharacterized protein
MPPTRPNLDDDVRVVLRPLGTPLALGLAAIFFGTTMLSGLQLEWLAGADQQQTVGFVALAGAFPLELLAAVLAFLARDPLAGTGFGVFSSVWSISGLSLLTGPAGGTNDALGMFLILAAIGLALLLASAGGQRLLLGLMIATGCVRLLLTGLYEIKATSGLQHAAGVVGLVLGGLCAYGIVALLMEDLPRRTVLPIGRSGRAEASMDGAFAEQLEGLRHEAGVRRQL